MLKLHIVKNAKKMVIIAYIKKWYMILKKNLKYQSLLAKIMDGENQLMIQDLIMEWKIF